MAQCTVCDGPFQGRGRKARCESCTHLRVCIECRRVGVTNGHQSRCSSCQVTDRICGKCGSPHRGRESTCGPCHRLGLDPEHRAKVWAEWSARNDHTNETRWRHVASKFNLTRDEFMAILEAQGGSCALCGAIEPGGRKNWHIDHDHRCCPGVYTCGTCVRGLLCHKCNTALGMLRDDPDLLRRAADYVERGPLRPV